MYKENREGARTDLLICKRERFAAALRTFRRSHDPSPLFFGQLTCGTIVSIFDVVDAEEKSVTILDARDSIDCETMREYQLYLLRFIWVRYAVTPKSVACLLPTHFDTDDIGSISLQ